MFVMIIRIGGVDVFWSTWMETATVIDGHFNIVDISISVMVHGFLPNEMVF